MKKITIRELYQRVLDDKDIIKKIRYRNDIYEYNKEEHFYRCYDDYGSYWLPFNLDDKVEILGDNKEDYFNRLPKERD